METRTMSECRLLGKTGLRVSPLCLGTMTFGTEWGWGCGEDSARRILGRYLDAGGNFIDTAEVYNNGASEEMLGRFLKEDGRREHVVLASKFSFGTAAGDPNSGGNGRKNMLRALEGTLRRLRTDFIDVYWLNAWDMVTPVEEVLSTMDTLVKDGKVRYIGLSNTPAWYAARAQTLAQWRGWERICGLQMEYSLVERDIEREHIPTARHLGMGICAWSPLANGFLTGKYGRNGGGVEGRGRIQVMQETGNVFCPRFSDREWNILGVLVQVAKELRRSPAQVAVNWVCRQPQVVSTLIGATDQAQLGDMLAALEFDIPAEHMARLEECSRLANVYPYTFFTAEQKRTMSGGVNLREPVLTV